MFLIATSLLTIIAAKAQESLMGRVTYEHLIKLEIQLEGAAAQYADLIPRERRTEKILWYNSEATLFENGAPQQSDMPTQAGQANVMIRMAEPDNKIYTRLADGAQIEQRDFMTRLFLIEEQPVRQWKLTGQQKLILDMPCMEAVMGEGDKKVTAWFTPIIPVSSGPANYGGLPGLILMLETADGRQVYTAVKVEQEITGAAAIVQPDKGRKVTREEFNDIVAEKMKEMGGQPGQGGQQVIFRFAR